MSDAIHSPVNNPQGEGGLDELHLLAGKYLTFALGEEVYGIDILKVIEIIEVMKITSVPRSPDYLKGVINLRGKIIPVVDLRMKFGMSERAHDARTCIIVVDVAMGEQSIAVGMIVDTVLEVRDFERESLSPAPEFGVHVAASFVTGMGRYADDSVVILIDTDRALESQDKSVLQDAARLLEADAPAGQPV